MTPSDSLGLVARGFVGPTHIMQAGGAKPPSPAAVARKRSREQGKGSSFVDDSKPPDIKELKKYLSEEEGALRASAPSMLNREMVAQAEKISSIEERLSAVEEYQEALDSGLIAELQRVLRETYRLGTKLEAWMNTFTPPLASGGNVAVSGEVQDGMYANIHGLTTTCSSALHAQLAFEKEYAVNRSKITDEAVWERFKKVLELNMLHDANKAALQVRADLLNAANSLVNNLSHLSSVKEEMKMLAHMY